jgi:hypothetical protein
MSPLIRAILLATGIAIIGVVVYQQFFQTSDDQSWETLGVATKADSIQALEAARDQAAGGPAKPWIDYELAMRLYDLGGKENFERSRQVAQAALDAHPTHATAPWLKQLIAAIGTYDKALPAQ